MSGLTQERSHIHASIVKSPLATHHIASGMNGPTQERSRMQASIVKSPLGTHNAGNMKRDIKEPAILNKSNLINA